MLDALKQLFESNALSEEVRTELQEAWDAKVRENKQEVTAELREEFAQKYEHDKQTMVEAVDAMISERLAEEIQEFAEDRQQLAEAKAKYAIAMRENADLLKGFVMEQLSKEVSELHEDKTAQQARIETLEEFIVESLAKEIAEFNEDKKDLAETKVRLVKEAKTHLAKVKSDFVARGAKAVSETVSKTLNQEITALKEDIEAARKNDFGRKLFEAFASEYSTSYLNEKSETAKLLKVLETKDKQLDEAKTLAVKAKTLAEAQEKQNKRILAEAKRKDILNDLVGTLPSEQRDIMTDLLESVQTARLQSAFDKYLPAVIDGKGPAKRKAVLSEAKEITGNREKSQTNVSSKADADHNVIDIKRLAGL